MILIVLFGDTETQTGPVPGYSNSFSFCHWNSCHSDDDQLALPGYNLIRADNPNNIKR